MCRRALTSSVLLALWACQIALAGDPFPPNVGVDLACKKEVYVAGEPIGCNVTLTNHLEQSHLVYVPLNLFPVRLPHWPLALLELQVIRQEDGQNLANTYLEGSCILPPSFSARDLLLLDIGRSIGWELNLAGSYNWQYRFKPGTYRVKARVEVRLLDSMAASPKVRDEVRKAMGLRSREAEALVLNGILESNPVEFTVVQRGTK